MIYISVPRAAIATLLGECGHGPAVLRGCLECHRRGQAAACLRGYLRAAPPTATAEAVRAKPPGRFY